MQVIVVGAGLAGLAAAIDLVALGHDVRVYERADGPGGRIRTDVVDGFRLDRGFQILLSGYPEARRYFNYGALDLCSFSPGALVRYGGQFHRVSDPIREPLGILRTLLAPIGKWTDKMRVLAFLRSVRRGSLDDLWQRPETSALERLRAAEFSDDIIERFFRPLFAGITLDPELAGSSRVLEFVFRMLASGDNVVPRLGMGELGAQLARRLPGGSIRYDSPVAEVSRGRVTLEGGGSESADAVIVATDMSAANALVDTPERPWKSVTSVWYAADQAPTKEPLLLLNGEGRGAVNSAVVMSNVSRDYAPEGQHCVVATSQVESPTIDADITRDLATWWPAAAGWPILRIDRIERAQPRGAPRQGVLERNGVWVCGDHVGDASINGALESGRLAAEAVQRAVS